LTIHAALTTLLDRLDSGDLSNSDVIPWGCPVLAFGDLANSRVATVGLNPSNREFVDECGNELRGELRRFHTLESLGLASWSEVDARHLKLILESCQNYFVGNPYDRWFRKLDFIVGGADASFYERSRCACHIDLIPYATARKWTDLRSEQRATLMRMAGDSLRVLLRESAVGLLILNGQTVVDHFQDITQVELHRVEMEGWSLPRRSGKDVRGFAYSGSIDAIGSIWLGRSIDILGFNHNLQSSYGVTSEVTKEVRHWVGTAKHAVR
jgi:hypothetical protein